MSPKFDARIHEYTRGKGFGQSHWVLVACILLYLLISVSLFKVFPPPWPDEVIFAVPANSLFETGELRTPVVIGLEHHTFWMPPAYFVVLGSFFRVFGFSLEAMRAFSVLCGTTVLILTYLLCRQMKLSFPFLALAMVLVVVDPFFLRYSKMGRMDSFCLIWILSTLVTDLAWLETRKRGWSIVSVLCSVLAAASHPVGLTAPAGLFLQRLVQRRREGIGLLSLMAPVIGVVILCMCLSFYWSHDLVAFQAQMQYQFTKKLGQWPIQSLVNWVTRYRSLPPVLFVTVSCLFYEAAKNAQVGWSRPSAAVTIYAVIAFGIATTCFELFYPVYYVPLVAIIIACILADLIRGHSKLWSKLAAGAVGLALMNALLFDGYFLYLYLVKQRSETSITSFAREANNLIPPHSNVLLLGIPSLYWELARLREDLSFYDGIFVRKDQQEKLVKTIHVVIETRAFHSSDDQVMANLINQWAQSFLNEGKALKRVGSIGHEKPFAYRGTVFRAETAFR